MARALEALDPDYVDFRKTTTGGDPTFWYVLKVTPQARRVVGQWPTPDSFVTRLAEELSAAASQEDDAERKGLLSYAARLVGDTLREAAVRAAGQVLSPAISASRRPRPPGRRRRRPRPRWPLPLPSGWLLSSLLPGRTRPRPGRAASRRPTRSSPGRSPPWPWFDPDPHRPARPTAARTPLMRRRRTPVPAPSRRPDRLPPDRPGGLTGPPVSGPSRLRSPQNRRGSVCLDFRSIHL